MELLQYAVNCLGLSSPSICCALVLEFPCMFYHVVNLAGITVNTAFKNWVKGALPKRAEHQSQQQQVSIRIWITIRICALCHWQEANPFQHHAGCVTSSPVTARTARNSVAAFFQPPEQCLSWVSREPHDYIGSPTGAWPCIPVHAKHSYSCRGQPEFSSHSSSLHKQT